MEDIDIFLFFCLIFYYLLIFNILWLCFVKFVKFIGGHLYLILLIVIGSLFSNKSKDTYILVWLFNFLRYNYALYLWIILFDFLLDLSFYLRFYA